MKSDFRIVLRPDGCAADPFQYCIELKNAIPRSPVARSSRDVLREAGVLTVSIIGGPGCGKTTLLDATIGRLLPDVTASRRNADRIARYREQVVQVNTGEDGTFDASHIRDPWRWADPKQLDLLFIENVGTLTVPAVPDMGQDATAAVFSVAGGDDKADRHPELVRAADLVVLNKTDLLRSVPFNLPTFRADVRRLNPRAELFEISSLHGRGLESWLT